jgi:hypothetical protein
MITVLNSFKTICVLKGFIYICVLPNSRAILKIVKRKLVNKVQTKTKANGKNKASAPSKKKISITDFSRQKTCAKNLIRPFLKQGVGHHKSAR